MKYCDGATFGDIKRLGRIPLSIHQKSGEKCVIVNKNLKLDKLRSITFFRLYGLKLKDIKRATNLASHQLEKQEEELAKRKELYASLPKFTGDFAIRPCFKEKMDAGEMEHPQRRALCVEAFRAGHKIQEAMIELFRCFNDWDGNKSNSKCVYQINYWFDETVVGDTCKVHPYRCETIQEKGWCIYEKCHLFRRQKNGKQSTEKTAKKGTSD